MKIKFNQDRETILKILESANIMRKLRVLDKLNGVNEKDSIKILLKVLEDDSWCLREKAAYKLVQYGKKIVPRLNRLLKRGYWFTRAAACITLGEIGDIKALNAVITLLLNDENPTVIKEAKTTLIKIAEKNPDEFSIAVQELEIEKDMLSRILLIIEKNAPELYRQIKLTISNE